MSKAEILFDGKPMKTAEDYQRFFQSMGEISLGLREEFQKQMPDDPLVRFSQEVAFTFNAIASGNTLSAAIAWSLTTHILMFVAQGRITFRFQESPAEFNVADVIAEAERIINHKS